MTDLPKSVTYEDKKLFFLDQVKLPLQVCIEEQKSVSQVFESIQKLKVRGAPAIGIAGAYGLLVGLRGQLHLSRNDFFLKLDELVEYLNGARPTAVNLSWALNEMRECALSLKEESVENIFFNLEKQAIKLHEDDKRLCLGIGQSGLHLIKDGMGILTHCNAGALAVSELGTALAPLYLAHEKGVKFKVYADETRPLLQGARLTSLELQAAGIDVTLITDSMAAHMMNTGQIDMVIVGADRVVANGDVANKIGTLGLAILCRHFKIPFYVACPSSTIDLKTKCGKDIVIEERDVAEVASFGERQTAPDGIQVRNPAFDVTPHELVTGLITEKELVLAPYANELKRIFKK